MKLPIYLYGSKVLRENAQEADLSDREKLTQLIADMEETLATRAGHEAVTHEAEALLKVQGCETMALSTEACAICDHCAYPAGPCRHPDQMYPCVESHGILVTAIAEQLGLEFFNGNLVTWYSLVFYKS